MDIENNLGADIIMAFDQCSPYGMSHADSKKAMDRTLKWLDRCYNHHKNPEQALFPIVQGNMFKDLRLTSLKETIPYAKYGIAKKRDLYVIKNYCELEFEHDGETWLISFPPYELSEFTELTGLFSE
jgi:queuine/archaeosine tRNA-ribosyltransferase